MKTDSPGFFLLFSPSPTFSMTSQEVSFRQQRLEYYGKAEYSTEWSILYYNYYALSDRAKILVGLSPFGLRVFSEGFYLISYLVIKLVE